MPDPEVSDLIDEMDHELLEGIVYKAEEFPTGSILHHYTGSGGLIGILKDKELHATHFRFLNDRSELTRAEKLAHDSVAGLAGQEISAFRKGILDGFLRIHAQSSLTKVTEVFVASLSEREDLLSQWRAYGANGSGYSIGISGLPEFDSGSDDPAIALGVHKCIYDDKAFEADVGARVAATLAVCDRVASRGGNQVPIVKAGVATLLRAMAHLVPKLKHWSFREECEWRIIAMPFPQHMKDAVCFKPSQRGVVPFIKVPLARGNDLISLDHVCVGPTLDTEAAGLAASMLLECHGYPDPAKKVKMSQIPFVG